MTPKGDISMESKKIILNSTSNDNKKGILDFSNVERLCVVKIKGYNIKFNKTQTLIIKNADNQHKIELDSKLETYSIPLLDLSKKVACLLVENQNGSMRPLLWGGTELDNQQEIESETLNNNYKHDNNINNKVMPIINSNSKEDLFDENDEEIENCIENCMKKDNFELSPCSNCRYKKHFYDEDKMEEAKDVLHNIAKMQEDEKKQFFGEENNNSDKDPYFYSLVKNQYEDMFSKYATLDDLSQIIPSSKWIKVEMEDGYYVLGLIYEEDVPKYMCYGVPQTIRTNPPKELENYGQWLPLDAQNPNGSGYYIMYQSAESGENIEVEII